MGSNLISCSTYPPKLDISSVPQAQSSHTLRPSPQSTVTDYHSYSHSHISLPSIITNDLRPQILEKTESESPVRDEPEGDVVSVKFETFSHSRIRPFVPEGIKRYDRNVKIPKEYTDYRIAPLTTSFDMPNLPAGWTPCFHPEGGLYFFHKDKRVFTDANLYQHEILSRVLSDIEAIEKFLRVHNIRRSSWIDLVLELEQGDDPDTLYYLIDHSNRSVFFLDEFDASNLLIWQEVDGVSTPTHVNQIISATSTVPYSVEDLQKMLNLVNSMEKCTDGSFHGSTRVLSCLMFVFVRQRFYNFHGQPCARLERDQSVYEQTQNKRSWLIVSLSPILFFAPEVHLRALEKVWIDGITRTVLWKEFVGKLYDEWQEFTLYGTVLLNANVAFLAIQSVDENHTDSRSLAQIASYTSIAASLGSIILGLLLVRQYRSKGRDVVEATGYLHRRSNKIMGMETLAIMFALPYALLMWGCHMDIHRVSDPMLHLDGLGTATAIHR
ncbi:hypothetical protein H0H81_011766 [Sphagnurus paluster]|uniref:Uncharacterized protein n=1 Tax=Sphagnurus paluster TaxID=117069 RepID=A0A9P7K299_9AGAR|nr:hypothetical protein H0H81_011766 [Sphagnurus paluster]